MNTEIKSKIKTFGLVYLAFLIYAGTTVFSKYASMQNGINYKFILFIGLEIVTLGVYAILWQQVLKRVSLVTAMSNKGVVVIFSMIFSVLLFGETVNLFNMIGALIIIIGIWVVSSDD